MSTHDSPLHQQFHEHTANGHSTDIRCLRSSETAIYDDLVRNADLFWEKLKALTKSSGKKFKVPTVGGNSLDLHRLFLEVTSRGGIEKVIKDRRWKEVIGAFNFPTTITSASFVLRKYYLALLYHFEQVYYLQKQVSPVALADDAAVRSLSKGSSGFGEITVCTDPVGGAPELRVGSSVIGTIDGKFDSGYLVTVKSGSEELKGVLYHIAPHTSYASQPDASAVPSRRHRKRSRLAMMDSSRPKCHRSGYNFFFSEQYALLKPQYHGQERALTKTIGHLWSNLSESEKQVYQERGIKDVERYRTEMLEYKSSFDAAAQ